MSDTKPKETHGLTITAGVDEHGSPTVTLDSTKLKSNLVVKKVSKQSTFYEIVATKSKTPIEGMFTSLKDATNKAKVYLEGIKPSRSVNRDNHMKKWGKNAKSVLPETDS